jgi:hypothetical protein
MSVVSVADVSSSWSVDGSASWVGSMDAWDENRVSLAETRCKGGRADVGEAWVDVKEAVALGSLGVVAEGLDVWVISA